MACTSKKDSRPSDSGDAWLTAAVLDAMRLCETRSVPRFVGFLDERQRAAADKLLRREGCGNFAFYGGYDDAERTYLGVFPDGMDGNDESAFPISAIAFRYRTGVALAHRDFLGMLLSCGVKREKVGDILCGDGLSVAFAETGIARFLEGQITKVGGEGVSVIPDYHGELPAAHSFSELRDTVASPRLDAVVKIAVGCSREEAARRIEAGLVSVNHIPCLSASGTVREKDVLSIRGVGRFVLQTLGPVSRKGRLFITILKYQ